MVGTDNKPQEQVQAAPQPQQPAGPQVKVSDQMASARPCPKDCRKCSWMQQVCCSSMMSFQMFGVMNAMMEKIDAQSKVIVDLSGRIATLEAAGTDLASPMPVQGELFPSQE